MRHLLILMLLAGCTERPIVGWPPGALPATPDLLPLDAVGAVPGTDPGPAVAARGAALRAWAAGGTGTTRPSDRPSQPLH
ncbi:hypothetical protein NX862_02110 [Rhodobacter sp. KR11]|uniref:hypothetical protein n=1 Tax=Rhodobacter sp. KR11 TaxID=2974588 RepID=UPI002223C1DD|nr:hypothetical protein [Rhodobacter sp. KR11]MCW1917539.1 hypothetical protein [Rhodobacter sp. KR11]